MYLRRGGEGREVRRKREEGGREREREGRDVRRKRKEERGREM